MYTTEKIERICKIIFVAMFSFYISIVALNNITDYNSNYEFVKHVMLMDTTFKNNELLWRSISFSQIHRISYIFLIAYEIVTAILGWVGTFYMIKNYRECSNYFHTSKRCAIISLMLNLVMWFFAFNTIGGEWFLMWQSQQWNGVGVARPMFVAIAIVFLYITRKDDEI
ncbi:DUF2165 family protein [Fluviispira sanaruensis]|uniref:DUF2165 domain-containing protein n=1 Tax=Fluviispira sanaruensis TaxID=2493639 RepID=A0A4P2VSI3_FLUSA|nr:DUF2165 domain-containing protein [Fluviispira sanaruensis]BBH52245.1 DUF2165 domain-containing protein [Fluviispira sanaruensis]